MNCTTIKKQENFAKKAISYLYFLSFTITYSFDSLQFLTTELNQLTLKFEDLTKQAPEENYFKHLAYKISQAIKNQNLTDLSSDSSNEREYIAYKLLHFLFNRSDFWNIANPYIYKVTGTIIGSAETTDFSTRILFAVKLVHDLKNKCPNLSEKIILSSLGAGSLFQEYLIIKALAYSGYQNIKFHVVDINVREYIEACINLQTIIKKDDELKNTNIEISPSINAYELITESKNQSELINACYMTSPVGILVKDDTALLYVDHLLRPLFRLRMFETSINAIKLINKNLSILLCFPYDLTHSFALSKVNNPFAESMIHQINEALKNVNQTVDAKTTLSESLKNVLENQKNKGVNVMKGNDITLAFYDIIKEIGTKEPPCLCYRVLGNKIKTITSVTDPYYGMIGRYEFDRNSNVWYYDVINKQYIQATKS